MELTPEEKEALKIFHENKAYREEENRKLKESIALQETMKLPYPEHRRIEIQESDEQGISLLLEQERKDIVVLTAGRYYQDGGDIEIELNKEQARSIISFLTKFISSNNT